MWRRRPWPTSSPVERRAPGRPIPAMDRSARTGASTIEPDTGDRPGDAVRSDRPAPGSRGRRLPVRRGRPGRRAGPRAPRPSGDDPGLRRAGYRDRRAGARPTRLPAVVRGHLDLLRGRGRRAGRADRDPRRGGVDRRPGPVRRSVGPTPAGGHGGAGGAGPPLVVGEPRPAPGSDGRQGPTPIRHLLSPLGLLRGPAARRRAAPVPDFAPPVAPVPQAPPARPESVDGPPAHPPHGHPGGGPLPPGRRHRPGRRTALTHRPGHRADPPPPRQPRRRPTSDWPRS